MKQIYEPYEYQKYCISRCISDDKLGLFLDMRTSVKHQLHLQQ